MSTSDQIRAAMADMDAEIQRSDRGMGPPSYNVAQFAQEISPLLPLALPEFRRCGLMKACAHCGNPLDGVTFVLRNGKTPSGNTLAHLLALCDACARRPADLSPHDWPHARVGGLLLQQCEWAQFTRVLRRHVMTLSRAGVILRATDTP